MTNSVYKISKEEEFSLIVSHEMREPLRLLCNYARLMEDQADTLGVELRQYVHIIGANAASLYNLVTALLEYSQAGMRAGKSEPFDTAQAMKEALEPVRYLLENANASLICGNLPVLHGDRPAFIIIMRNLLTNAVKYARPGVTPVISVKAMQGKGEWLFEVSDNGIGIHPRDLRDVFVPLKRFAPDAAHSSGGLGLGLAIARRLVEQSGGKISVRSVPGEGSSFCFTVPVIPGRQSKKSPRAAKMKPTKRQA